VVKDIELEINEHKKNVLIKACGHYKLIQNITAEGYNFEGMDGFTYLGSRLARVVN
jgi:glutamate racemase